MPTVYVFKDTKQRANIYAQYTDADGVTHLRVPEDLVEAVEIVQPADFDHDLYDVLETDAAPYVEYKRKPDADIYAQQLAHAKRNRAAAFNSESDPVFFKEQRGEVEAGTWLKLVEEIKARFPYPEAPAK